MVITQKSRQFSVKDLGIPPNMYTKESYKYCKVKLVAGRKQVKLPTSVNRLITVDVSLTTLAVLQYIVHGRWSKSQSTL